MDSNEIVTWLQSQGGQVPFDQWMAHALYHPTQGYYTRSHSIFGRWPLNQQKQTSDFVTAPHISPAFGMTLALQIREAMHVTGVDEIWEWGPGSGHLADAILTTLAHLDALPQRYVLLDISPTWRAVQQERLAGWGDRVQWRTPDLHDHPETTVAAIVLANEWLDALPVKSLRWWQGQWWERWVRYAPECNPPWTWHDVPTSLRPPTPPHHDDDLPDDYHTEQHTFYAQALQPLGERWRRGVGFWIDYGETESRYYHPSRTRGTLRCFQHHHMHDNPLIHVGEQDITTHVNFTECAWLGEQWGWMVLGFTSQAHFLLNNGLPMLDEHLGVDFVERMDRHWRLTSKPLFLENEMGESFKVLAMAPETPENAAIQTWQPQGFSRFDRLHQL